VEGDRDGGEKDEWGERYRRKRLSSAKRLMVQGKEWRKKEIESRKRLNVGRK
jgi:hypothetical protein